MWKPPLAGERGLESSSPLTPWMTKVWKMSFAVNATLKLWPAFTVMRLGSNRRLAPVTVIVAAPGTVGCDLAPWLPEPPPHAQSSAGATRGAAALQRRRVVAGAVNRAPLVARSEELEPKPLSRSRGMAIKGPFEPQNGQPTR